MVGAAQAAATDSGQLSATGAAKELPHAPFASQASNPRAKINEPDGRTHILSLTIPALSDAIDADKAHDEGEALAKMRFVCQGSENAREHPLPGFAAARRCSHGPLEPPRRTAAVSDG
jgi:hypothetical protein